MTTRMKWTRDPARPWLQVSACGRFEVGGNIWTQNGTCCYVRLFDTLAGKEYPCRTETSAKTAARNIRTIHAGDS